MVDGCAAGAGSFAPEPRERCPCPRGRRSPLEFASAISTRKQEIFRRLRGKVSAKTRAAHRASSIPAALLSSRAWEQRSRFINSPKLYRRKSRRGFSSYMAHPIRRVGLDSEGQERPWVEGSGRAKAPDAGFTGGTRPDAFHRHTVVWVRSWRGARRPIFQAR